MSRTSVRRIALGAATAVVVGVGALAFTGSPALAASACQANIDQALIDGQAAIDADNNHDTALALQKDTAALLDVTAAETACLSQPQVYNGLLDAEVGFIGAEALNLVGLAEAAVELEKDAYNELVEVRELAL